jgi:hypothetical protein
MSARNIRISPSGGIDAATTGINTSAIASEDAAIEKNGDASCQGLPGVKFDLNGRHLFYHKIVPWMILKISGKSSERLIFESEIYRINGLSRWRAHWRATFRAPIVLPNHRLKRK